MQSLRFIGTASSLFLFACAVSGCGHSEGTCATGCPATGQPAEAGDLRLLLESENSSVVIEDGSDVTDGKIMSGEMVIHPEVAGCLGSPDHPCSALLRKLTLTITDLTAGDFYFQQPTLSIDGPLSIVDAGSGYVLEQDTDIHTCVALNGGHQHAVGKGTAAAAIMFDDTSWAANAGVSAYAHLHAWWPLILVFPVDGCMTKTLPLVVSASFSGG